MSDLNYTISPASTVVTPVETDLTNPVPGVAADAVAVKNALALKANASDVKTYTVNDHSADENGNITISASDIDCDNNQTVQDNIDSIAESVETLAETVGSISKTVFMTAVSNGNDGLNASATSQASVTVTTNMSPAIIAGVWTNRWYYRAYSPSITDNGNGTYTLKAYYANISSTDRSSSTCDIYFSMIGSE